MRWQDGKTFGMVYDAGPEAHAVVEAVAQMFLHDNALNTQAFPSLARIQSDVVRITADLLHGDEDVAGFMTSGGTESILCAVKAARERGREERGITEPEMVVPASAHAAFHKAAHYFGIRLHKVPVRDDWRADVDAMAALVGPEHRARRGQRAAVPAGRDRPDPRAGGRWPPRRAPASTPTPCMGGFVLPFMEELGHDVPPWDFRVDGVTTISADLHKLGYAPKGASVVLHRTKALRRYQTFVFDDWLGGFYASSGHAGHPLGAADGHRVGHAPPPRPWRATCGSPSSPSRPAPGWSRASAPSTGSPCSASRRRSASPWPPRRATRTPSTCSRWATRCGAAAGSTIARSRPTRCTPPSAPATRR